MATHPVSEWMKKERNRRGWKQTDVAARLRAAGYDAADGTYRVWETGRPPKRATIEALERMYESVAPRESEASSDISALVAALWMPGIDVYCSRCGATLTLTPAPVPPMLARAAFGLGVAVVWVRLVLLVTIAGVLWDMAGRPGPDEFVAFFERTWGQIING